MLCSWVSTSHVSKNCSVFTFRVKQSVFILDCLTPKVKVQTGLTFIQYKFSPLILLSYAELDFCTQLRNKNFELLHSHTVKLSPERYFEFTKCQKGWSQWQCRLRGVLWLLACWDWGFESCQGHGCLSVCRECCVLSRTGVCNGLITRPEESYWVWCV